MRVVDWHCNADAKQWLLMEGEDAGLLLPLAPWLSSSPSELVSNHALATLREVRLLQ